MKPVLRTATAEPSRTMDLNSLFLVLWTIVQIANAFGFTSYTPPADLLVIAPAIVALINIALRYLHVA
jgi:uncharacterized membrane-anchored protein